MKRFLDFLKSNGYLFVFTIVCILSLSSYIISSTYYDDIFLRGREDIISKSSVKGVWTSSDVVDCPKFNGFNIDSCTKEDPLTDYLPLDRYGIVLDSNGKASYEKDGLVISTFFSVDQLLNPEIWPNVYLGDLNVRVNDRQWVYEDVIWTKNDQESLVDIYSLDSEYIIVISTNISMVGRESSFALLSVDKEDFSVERLNFRNTDTVRSYWEGSVLEMNINSDKYTFVITTYDPALDGNTLFEIFEWGDNLELIRSILLLNGY